MHAAQVVLQKGYCVGFHEVLGGRDLRSSGILHITYQKSADRINIATEA
jgi:hypothetical protein